MLSSTRSCRSSICPGRLSTAWMISLVVFYCHMVSKWWHARSIGRIWGGWYALPRTISFFSHRWLYLWLLSSPWLRCWSSYPRMWCWAYLFRFWSARPQVCSVLVWSLSSYLHLVCVFLFRSFLLSALVFSITEPMTIMWSFPMLMRLKTVTSVTMLSLSVMM